MQRSVVEIRPVAVEADESVAREIYLSSFPPEERRPWEEIVRGTGNLALFGIYADGKISGLVTTWTFDSFLYIEHLALAPDLRGKGIGSEVIKSICGRSGVPVVLEIEPPETSAQAASRLRFYERAGFFPIDKDYIQPSYGRGLPSVCLWLMSTAAINPSTVAQTLHRHVYGKVDA